jgi:U4/U6.U5 tri-snRNP-associated protein 3
MSLADCVSNGRGLTRHTVDTSEARSPSPRRDRGSARQRSPPRGPRVERDSGTRERNRSRDRGAARPARTNGAAPTAGPRARTNGSSTTRDVSMGNGAVDDDEDEEVAMERLMGFGAFKTTKNTKVPGNSKNYGVRKEKKTEYRQYMNRQGGFNRPLSPGK